MRKKIFTTFILGLIAILFVSTVFKPFLPNMVAPNLTVIILVYLAFFEASALGAFLSFMLGLELDLCSAGLLGPWAGVYALTFLLLYITSRRIFVESFLVLMVATFVASFTTTIFHHCFIMIVREKTILEAGVVSDAMLEGVITALIAPFLIKLFKSIPFRRKSKQEHLSFLRN